MSTVATSELALHGGAKTRTTPWPPRRHFGEDEKLAALRLFDRAIQSGNAFGYDGEEEQAYCREFAEFQGGGFADAVNSGTSAVYVALRALEIEPFTEIIVPPITDPGGVMPVPLINCIPIVADAAPGSYNTAAAQIARRITERTSAILVAHISGIPCDMDPIMELARSRKIPVIEDCAQAHGARYKGRLVGTIGDIAAFSTMFSKHHATAAQGGVVFTKDESLYWRCRRASDRGKPFGLSGAKSNVVASLNFNSNDLASAVGRVQLRKLPAMLEGRRRFAAALTDGCRRSLRAVRAVEPPSQCESSYWFLFLRLELESLRVDKQAFVAALRAEGIPVEPTYLSSPVLAEWYMNRAVFGRSGLPWSCPLYKGDPHQRDEIPNAIATDERHFRLLMHENCTQREADDVIRALAKVEAAMVK